MSPFLPFALPLIGQEEIAEVIDTLSSGWLTTGPKVARFENDFSDFIGAKYALAVNSATAGLHLALETIGVRAGDKVITTPYTFTATAEVIRYLGADPVFVDIDPTTFNIDPSKIEQQLIRHKNVKAIIPVHFAGQACEMEFIVDIAKSYNCAVVEDAAHALPATNKGQLIGTIGDITVFSFYVTKTITTGEGGMIVTNNENYNDGMKMMRLHGINKDVFNRYVSDTPSWYYEVVAPGYKYNMPDIAASIGIHQLKKVTDLYKRRKWIAERYTHGLTGLPIKLPFIKNSTDIHSWHLYVIQLELEKLCIDRNRFIELMSDFGIGTSVHFIPLHIQPYWRNRYGFKPDDFPIAFDVYSRVVSLPIYPKMTNLDIENVILAVQSILGKYYLPH